MRGVLKFAAALWLTMLATAPAVAADARFDAMIADAKSTMLADPEATLAKARDAERYAGQLADPEERTTDGATAQWLQGEAYLRVNDPAHAEPLIAKAFATISPRRPLTGLHGELLLTRGGLHAAHADVGKALADYQTAFTVFRKVGDTRKQAIALLSIAALYNSAKDNVTALKYYGQALDVYRDPALSMSIYNNRGNSLEELKRFDEAEREFAQALKLARQMKSPLLEARVLGNIARTRLDAGQLDQADQAIEEGLRIAQDGEAAGFRSRLIAIAAQSALQRGDLGRARVLIARSFEGVDPTQTAFLFREAHDTAYQIYSQLGDSRQALIHLTAVKRLDDDATKLATETNTSLMAARFNSANQEASIQKLKATEAESRARFQQIIFGGLALATLIGVSMLAFGYVQIRRSRDKVRAANVDLEASNSALEKALAAKTEFLATTSHEIRTPLNGILGMTQVMLADRGLSDSARDRIGIVHGAGITMRALVDDILDVAKMETGNLTIENVPLDLKATLRDVTRMWEEQARAKGLDFILDLDGCPGHVLGDAARLRQIVFNLLSNAVKFTESGSVTLRGSCDGERLHIAVSDTGIGVPADKHSEIFESFKQADGGTTRKYGGTGLGLTIVRNLAGAMDGDVRIESAPGKGSTFTVDLPLHAVAAPEASVQATAGGLLIVDRNPIARAMLRAVLEKRAGPVGFASSLEEAVTSLDSAPVATVVIDDVTAKAAGDAMGEGLGALTAKARQMGARTAMLWADSDQSPLDDAAIDAVIAKPISGPALAEHLFGAENPDNATSALVSRAA